jgi:hypothetical protein
MTDNSGPVYYQQSWTKSDHVVGFRNRDDEPWIFYETGRNGAVLSFNSNGNYPLPEWSRIP